MIRFCAAFLILCATAAQAQQPLQNLADQVPADAQGWVVLSDVAAARAQAANASTDIDETTLGLMSFTPLNPRLGFDVGLLGLAPDGFKKALGFAVWDIAGLATWGEPPDGPAVVSFDKPLRPSTIGPALSARGYAIDSRAGLPVWHRQEDRIIDIQATRQDPFSGSLGQSGRFALKDDILVFTRTWPMLDRVLKGTETFGQRPLIKAIIDAAYARQDQGSLLEVVLLGPQSQRMIDAGVLFQSLQSGNASDEVKAYMEQLDYPGLPPFLNHALLLWQDGQRLTGAIAIPYQNQDRAKQALNRFQGALKSAYSLAAKRTLSDALPQERTFTIIPAQDRFVLMLMFHEQASDRRANSVMAFARHPQKTFLRMVIQPRT